METVVRAELAKITGGGGRRKSASALPSFLAGGLGWLTGSRAGEKGVCDCSHCSADVLALSLTNLPARYCLSLHYGVGRSRIPPNKVRQEVQMSIRRVRSRPRHAARESLPGNGEVKIVDFGIREGTALVKPLLQRVDGACCCDRCRADTLAYGLNRIRPRYGVEVKGRIRMPPHELEFIRHELLAAITEAAEKVAGNPRHETREDSQAQAGLV
jgi:hypothetical protein